MKPVSVQNVSSPTGQSLVADCPDKHCIQTHLSVLIYLYDLSGGGIERLSLLLLDEFRRMDMTVTLLLHCETGELLPLLPAGTRVISFDKRRMASDVFPLMRVLRREQPDILLSSQHHNNMVSLLAAAAAAAAAGRRTRVVVCQHNTLSREAAELGSWKYRIMPAVYRLLSPLMAGVVAVSAGVADDMARATGIARRRIAVIYNPVIGADFTRRASASAPEPWLDEALNKAGPPVFVSAGRLVPQKDHATLLRAFARAVRVRPARLLILGHGPLRPELERLAADLGIAEHVRFAGFVVNPLPYFRRACALVLSSRYEGSGNVLIEAMACGTPAISTDCPHGPAEILGLGRFGRLVAPGDVAALAAALDPDLRDAFSPETLRRRASSFTVRGSAEQYRGLMQSLVPSSRAGPSGRTRGAEA